MGILSILLREDQGRRLISEESRLRKRGVSKMNNVKAAKFIKWLVMYNTTIDLFLE